MNELLQQIALTLIPNIGDIHAKTLINYFGNASSIFKASHRELESLEGIGTIRANCIKDFNDFKSAEEEIAFIRKYKISPIFITDKQYPKRLLNGYDSPAMLYYRGTADLNSSKIVSIVGTRSNSEYGRSITENLIQELAAQQVLICSGLAFGIDTIAHKSALKNNLSTVAVLAHGLDMIYPEPNKSLAKQMTDHGGLLTDFRSCTNPDKQNFPKRNRIVAGLCDALIVMESRKKGGSLITAELANSYNKDVFAFPGRTSDLRSEGCNHLIKQNKAILITCAQDLIDNMCWNEEAKPVRKKQRQLFIELTNDEKIIVAILEEQDQIQIDDLHFESGLSYSAVASALLNLEMQTVILALPGKMYKLS